MIDLEKEYRAFENTWILLGASFKNFKLGENKIYQWFGDVADLTDSEKELTLTCINTALAMWLIQAKLRENEITALKQKLEKLESGEFVLVPREPTFAMTESGLMTLKKSESGYYIGSVEHIFKAMIEAVEKDND